MNDDHQEDKSYPAPDFEQSLRQQAQAEPPSEWRAEILESAFAETATAPLPEPRRRWQNLLSDWLPRPLRISLAAAWLLIAFLKISTPHSAPSDRTEDKLAIESSQKSNPSSAHDRSYRYLAFHLHRPLSDDGLEFFYNDERND